MAAQYWIRGSDGVQGPFDQLQIRGLVAIGRLTPSMEISVDEFRWQAASNVRGLFPVQAAKPILDFAPPDVGVSSPTSKPSSATLPSMSPSLAVPSGETISPAFWNPAAAVNWSLLFTAIFGSYLHIKNWEALGRPKDARTSRIWFWLSIAVMGIGVFSPLSDAASAGLGIWLLIIWYIFDARKQIGFIRERYGKNYPRRSFGKPVALGIGVIILVLIMVIFVDMVLIQIGQNFDKGRYGAGKAQTHALEMKCAGYILDIGEPPRSLDGLVTRPTGVEHWQGPYAKPSDLIDPFGHPFSYKSPGIHGDFDVIFLGKDGQPEGVGLDADYGNWQK